MYLVNKKKTSVSVSLIVYTTITTWKAIPADHDQNIKQPHLQLLYKNVA